MKDDELLQLILDTARDDARVRAVMLTGSRANPNAVKDVFQDFDIVYYVTEVASFTADHAWIDRFGERMILQMPKTMGDPPPEKNDDFIYLIQLMDRNRIDLNLSPVAKIGTEPLDSQSILLLDKDNLFQPLPPPSDRDYWPQAPSAKNFADCCNEFWWVSLYVAKGLARREILYAKDMMDQVVRPQLLKMLTWQAGIQTDFSRSIGKAGKYLE